MKKKATSPKKKYPFKIIIPLFLLASAAVIILVLKVFSGREDFDSLRGEKDFNVILITVDTLRADHIGCYGCRDIKTPTMDRFAARGVKFSNCIAATPLTLPSHTSIMTGTHPLFHGVRDNGGFLVPPQLDTIAEIFKSQGYSTSAFVAAYVLDSRWGLDQGFDTYFDEFDFTKYEKISLAAVQRPGNEVMDEALSWLEEHKGDKFFSWIHLYDPHTPYEPPAPYDAQYPRQPYKGEIAFTDSQLGRLWEYLEKTGLKEKTFIVFAADHGESLGEHEETSHGFFVYQEGIHVPLIFVTPFQKFQGVVSSHVSSLVDIMPTVMEMTGLPNPPKVQGESLVPLFFEPESDADNIAYSETFYPRYHFGWSELKSIQNRRYKLIVAPDLELYDLIQDPDEETNLVDALPQLTREMFTRADEFITRESQNALELDYTRMDEETREKLSALGYIGTFTDPSKMKGKNLANPREKISVFNNLSKAREMGMQDRVEEAIAMIREIIAGDPDIVDAYFSLGNILFKEGRFEEAASAFRESLDRKPEDPFNIINIANCYRNMGKVDDAETFLLGFVDQGLNDSQILAMLGAINSSKKKYPEAIEFYNKTIKLNPASSSSHLALTAIYIELDDLKAAESHIEAALKINPQLHGIHYHKAQIMEKRGNLSDAGDEYQKELEISPRHYKASFNLARIYRKLGMPEREEENLKKTIENNPEFALSYFYLARVYLNRGTDYKEAVDLVQTGISKKPEEKDLPLGYFLLADLYNRLGDAQKSLEYARKGQELVRGQTPRRP